ncbi:SDR family NAD(P)-dependent oxidoreductase [Nonomuraea sp. NPDC048826]|uniref:SDR family NAD(P)-dependent oxidoreductase n=1 Tax=Nonomuraea sp. NPDC048826 TaxID=3364347 RepID=UPI0037214AC9
MSGGHGPPECRVALVTGAARGIGAATARAFGAAGVKVVLAARSERDLRAVADDIADRGGQALAVPADVTDPVSVRRLVEQTLGAFGRLDCAVNNASHAGHPPTPLADVPVEDLDAAVAVGVRGTFLSMKYEIAAMLECGGGAIVNMSSTAGLSPVAGLAGYVSAKFALTGLTRTAALDYAGRGIRVNALAPGPVLTERLVSAGERARDRVAGTVPAGRLATPEEIAAAAVWLCGPQAAFVTGTTLTIDGGLLAGIPPFTERTPT